LIEFKPRWSFVEKILKTQRRLDRVQAQVELCGEDNVDTNEI